MSFLVAAAALCASGVGLLGALGLRTRRWAVDVPLGWFVGAGWLGLAMLVLRILLGVPYVAATAVLVLAAPLAAWGVREALRRRRGDAVPPGPRPARWLPRPAWLFAPMALYVAFVVVVVALHGLNSPTETDDGYRVRAFAPLLAHADRWEPAARGVLWMAGPVPTWVPSLAWRLGFPVDHFHVNATVLATLLAFLALAVGLASDRGRPEEGWGTAFVVLSLPLLTYHVTTTYADAPLALFLGAAFLLLVAWGRSGDPADAMRALLLLLAAAQVKREGEVLAGTLVAVLLAQAAWRARRDGWALPRRLALLLAPFVLVVAARAAASGAARSFDLLSLLASRGAGLAAPAPAAATPAGTALLPLFADALLGLGSTGLLYWVLPAAALLLLPVAWRSGLVPSLGALALLLAQLAVASLWLFPEFTRDQTTVHRALLPVSVPAAAWLAAVIAAACAGTPPATAPPAGSAPAAPGSSDGSGARPSTRGGGAGSRGSRRSA